MEEDKKEIKMRKRRKTGWNDKTKRRRKKTGGRKEEGEKPQVRKCGGIMSKRFKSRRREGCKGWRRGRRGRHAAGRTQTRVTSRFVATETFILNQTEMFFLTLINMKLSKSTQNSSETDKLRLFCGFAETYVAATLWRSGSLCDPPLFRHHVGLNISHEINYTSLCFRLQKPIFPPTAAHPASQLLIVVHLRPQHREERRRSLNTDDQTKIQSTGWLVSFLFWSESQLLKDCFSYKRTIIQ